MKVEVSKALEELQLQFPNARLIVRDDGQGGAYVVMESIKLSNRFVPSETWLGFQIPAQYPYADVYPVFMDTNVKRADGVQFVAPVTVGHNFEGRSAIQISRRTSTAQNGLQKANTKILKVINFLESLS